MTRDSQAPQSLDTLRLSDAQIASIVDQLVLRQSQQSPKGKETRAAVRLCFDSQKPVTVATEQMGGHIIRFKVHVWNLSSTGMAILHGNFIHKCTKCTVCLPNLSGDIVELSAYVMRCRLIAGHVHEIGLRFIKALDLTQFITDAQAGIAAVETGPNWQDPALRPVLETFVNQLPVILRDMNPKTKMISPSLRAKAAEQLRRAADGLGFSAIAVAAMELLRITNDSGEFADIAARFQALRAICEKTSVP